jgi:hypothetical protein
MIEQLATWLAADEENVVVTLGALLIAALFAYGIAIELMNGDDQ